MLPLQSELVNFNFNKYANTPIIGFNNFPSSTIIQPFPSNVYLSHIDSDNIQLMASWQNNMSMIWLRSGIDDFWKPIYSLQDKKTDSIFPGNKVRYLSSYGSGQYIFIAFVNSYDVGGSTPYDTLYTVLRSPNYGLSFTDITSVINSPNPVDWVNYYYVKYAIKGRIIFKAILAWQKIYIFQYDIVDNKMVDINMYGKEISIAVAPTTSIFDKIEFFDVDPTGKSIVLGLSITFEKRGQIFYSFNIDSITSLLAQSYVDYFIDANTMSNIAPKDPSMYSYNLYLNSPNVFPENFQCAVSDDASHLVFYTYNNTTIAPTLITNSTSTSLATLSGCFSGIGSLSFIPNTNNMIIGILSPVGSCLNSFTFQNNTIYIFYNTFACVNASSNYILWNPFYFTSSFGVINSPSSSVNTCYINVSKLNTYLQSYNLSLNFYNDGTVQLGINNTNIISTGTPTDTSTSATKSIKNIIINNTVTPSVLILNNNQSYILSTDSNSNLNLLINLMNSPQYNTWCRQNCESNSNLQCINLGYCLQQYKNYCESLGNYVPYNSYPDVYSETDPRCFCMDNTAIVSNDFNEYNQSVKNLMSNYGSCIETNCSNIRNITNQGEDSFPLNYTDVNCANKTFNICNTNIKAGGNVNIDGVLNILQNCGDSSYVSVVPIIIKPNPPSNPSNNPVYLGVGIGVPLVIAVIVGIVAAKTPYGVLALSIGGPLLVIILVVFLLLYFNLK